MTRGYLLFSQIHHLFKNHSSWKCTFLHRIHRPKVTVLSRISFLSQGLCLKFKLKILCEIMTDFPRWIHRKEFYSGQFICQPRKISRRWRYSTAPKIEFEKLTLKHKATSKEMGAEQESNTQNTDPLFGISPPARQGPLRLF